MTDVATAPPFPMARECPMHPPAEYASLRAERPIAPVTMPDGQRAWLVTKHKYARALLADPRVSSNRTHPAFPFLTEVDRASLTRDDRPFTRSMLAQDPPVHTTHRRAVITEFSVRKVQAMRPRIQQIVDECVNAMLADGGPLDLVQALSLPVPSLVICELLGVPYADREAFQRWTRVLVTRSSTTQERTAASDRLTEYLDKLVSAKEAAPTDDLLGRLIAKNAQTPTMDHTELVAMATLLLIAGHETTANMISLGVVALLERPDELTELRDSPGILPQAIEEMLRYFSIVDAITARVALADIEIGGVTIRAGEGLVVAVNAANWDDEVFAEPQRLDIHRSARHHVAFGFGVHQCLGQNLARAELEIVFETLFRRIPGLRLTVPAADLPYKDDANTYGVHEVPVTW
ncbi:MAG: cytochrome P450 [Kutzneria sp.]|nr:cytochrome P450 [Kutzneria sp.]